MSTQTDPGALRRPRLDASALLQRHPHLIRYVLIGATASAIDVMLFLLLFNIIGTGALTAHSISVPVSILFSFTLNAWKNFKTHDHLALRLCSFVVVCLIGYAAGYGIIEATVAVGSNANIGKIFSLPAVFFIQYILNTYMTFRISKH